MSDNSLSKNEELSLEEEDNIFSDNVMDYSQKQIINLDRNFSFNDFLDGAKSAFNLIVISYRSGKIKEVNNLLSKEVYENFKKTSPEAKEIK